MTISEDLRSFILADAEIVAIVGDNVSQNKIPQGVDQLPAIWFRRSTSTDELTLEVNPGTTVTGNTVSENEVEGSGTFGIRVEAHILGGGAGGNTVSENEVENSGGTDCTDNTSGGGTAGTANTWTENEGATSSPAGLCTD